MTIEGCEAASNIGDRLGIEGEGALLYKLDRAIQVAVSI